MEPKDLGYEGMRPVGAMIRLVSFTVDRATNQVKAVHVQGDRKAYIAKRIAEFAEKSGRGLGGVKNCCEFGITAQDRRVRRNVAAIVSRGLDDLGK